MSIGPIFTEILGHTCPKLIRSPLSSIDGAIEMSSTDLPPLPLRYFTIRMVKDEEEEREEVKQIEHTLLRLIS